MAALTLKGSIMKATTLSVLNARGFGHIARECTSGQTSNQVQIPPSQQPLSQPNHLNRGVKQQTPVIVSQTSGGSGGGRDDMCERAFGNCPIVMAKLGGVPIRCLLDSGSEISNMTEEFFNEHFKPKGQELLSTSGWLTITAANGLEIPYVGYFELDVEALGCVVSRPGVLVVKDPVHSPTRARKREVPGLLGMNILKEMPKREGTDSADKIDTVWLKSINISKKQSSE